MDHVLPGLDGFFRETCSRPGEPRKELTREQINVVALKYGAEFSRRAQTFAHKSQDAELKLAFPHCPVPFCLSGYDALDIGWVVPVPGLTGLPSHRIALATS